MGKLTVLLLSVILLISCESYNVQKYDVCIDPGKIDREKLCTTIYSPVCGCDNVTYGNNCVAEANGVLRWKPGECSD